jgi:hypothetical protein
MGVSSILSRRRQAKTFAFVQRHYDAQTGIVRLSYQVEDGPILVEKLVFPYFPWPADASRQLAFEQALELLHLVAGVSYWKAGLASKMVFPLGAPGPAVCEFLTELYDRGLAEFAYVNGISVSEKLNFLPDATRQKQAVDLLLPERGLVAMGGGKDSLVALDMLRKADFEVQPVCVGGSSLIRDTVAAARLPLIAIRREMAPELKQLNAAGAWNGHVPVTAINSAILVCAALLYGFRYIVFANERSADEATLITADGTAVNHQYSKSSAFEKAWQKVVHEQVSPDMVCFSLVRPLSELAIVKRFAAMPEFHSVYSSCNRNFHLDGPSISGRWCGDCPKCRFAALSLALFMQPKEVVAIQGSDLLDDPAQVEGFRELCALGREKPFECIGETGESRAALAALLDRPAWQGKFIVKKLAPELADLQVPTLEEQLKPAAQHSIPAQILKYLAGKLS